MKLLFALLSMTFLLSVGVLALGSVASIVAMFFGYPVGWGIAIAIFCLAFAGNGWKGLSNLNIGSRGISNNAEGAFCFLHIFALLSVALFATSSVPHNVSAFWAFLMPLLMVPALGIQWGTEILLNLVNPGGKRG